MILQVSLEFSNQLNKGVKTYRPIRRWCEDCRLKRYDLKHSQWPIDSMSFTISLTVNLSQFSLEADRYKRDTTQNLFQNVQTE